MGSDSRCTAGHVLPTYRNKIFTIDKMTMGTAGDVRYNNIIRYHMEVPYQRADMPDIEYICTEFVGCLRSAMETEKFSNEKNSISSVPNCSELLIAYKNNLYAIWSDYSVVEFSEYYAIGSGSDYALGSLETSKNLGVSPRKRIELALEAACKFSVGCAPPFNIIEQEILQ